MSLRISLLAAAAVAGMATAANAASISGSYSYTINNPTTDTVDLTKASTISFTGGGGTAANQFTSFTPAAGFQPGSVSACLNCGSIGNFTSLPPRGSLSPFTVSSNQLFSVQGLSFSLQSLTLNAAPSSQFLVVSGTGIYNAAGYSPTPGSFTIQVTQTSAAGTVSFGASGSGGAAALPAPVPEPASLALLGGSFAAIGFLRRRRTAA